MLLPILEIGRPSSRLYDDLEYSRFHHKKIPSPKRPFTRFNPVYELIFNPYQHTRHHVLLFVAIVGEDDLRECWSRTTLLL